MATGHTHVYLYRGLEILIEARQEEPNREWFVSVFVRHASGAILFQRSRFGSGFTSFSLADCAGKILGEEFVDEWVEQVRH